MNARRVLALTCFPVLALVGGCSGTPTSAGADPDTDVSATADPPEPAVSGVKPSCAPATPALLKQTLGVEVAAPTEAGADTTVECTYLSNAGGYSVIVRFRTGQDANTFAQGRRESDSGGEPTADVTGVGDEAYQSSVEFGDTVTNTLVARKGSVEILVTSIATVAAEKALITALFPKLP